MAHVLIRQRQVDPLGFQASLVYIMRPHAPPRQNIHVLLVSPWKLLGCLVALTAMQYFPGPMASHSTTVTVLNYSSCASAPKEQN